jgi:hypothetical protein
MTRATSVRVGLPRIDWKEVWLELGIDVAPPELFEAAGRLWLLRLGEAIDPAPAMSAAAHFTLMAAPAQAHGQELLRFAETCRSRILEHLRDIARPAPVRLPIVLLARSADYVSYTADLFPEEGEFATSGGMFIASEYPHLVLPAAERREHERVLGHELTHAHVSHLQLPPWLDEGFAVSMEQLLVGGHYAPNADDVREHRAYWTAATIQGLWNGEAFHDPDGQRLAYQLAMIFVRKLASDYGKLVEFANAAARDDAGEAAAQRVYGISLGDLPADLLGRGAWRPDPARWRWQSGSD